MVVQLVVLRGIGDAGLDMERLTFMADKSAVPIEFLKFRRQCFILKRIDFSPREEDELTVN